MKKLLLTLLIFSGLSQMANAQQYHALLDSANYWHYAANYYPLRMQLVYNCSYPQHFDMGEGQFTAGDTVINSTAYKIMNAGTPAFPCRYGYIREDTAAQKVYFMDVNLSPEVLLYDFSMQVNDSIYLNILYNTQTGYFEPGYYQLDSITTVNINSGARRKFYLNCHSCSNQRTMIWIESVGSPFDIVYPYYNNQYYGGGIFQCYGQPHDGFQFLICKENNNIKAYIDSCALSQAMSNGCIMFTDSCHYGNFCSSLDESNLLPELTLLPNPATDHLIINIELPQRTETEVILYDIYGRRIALSIQLGTLPAGNNEQRISLPSLPGGLYFAECRTKSGSAFQKIIIQQ